MPAIHVIRGRSGSLLVMMCGNRAKTGPAAGHLIRRPYGAGERRVKQNNHEQADDCGNRTAAILTRSLHVIHERMLFVRHYSVTRHSLQAELEMASTSVIGSEGSGNVLDNL
jgi:hypothetical protein